MGAMLHTSQDAPDAAVVSAACDTLVSGGVLVMPTDSVYGIGCAATPDNPALARVFAIKRRPLTQTLPLLICSMDQFRELAADVDPRVLALADAFWPGAMTIVVKASDALPPEYVAADGTVALRIPDSSLVRTLAATCGPLAVTSANEHGDPAAISGAELADRLIDLSDLIVDAGPAPVGVASTIIDGTKPVLTILRQGALGKDELAEVYHGADASTSL
jgi:L-threonylcarbamoyladenylate synthase